MFYAAVQDVPGLIVQSSGSRYKVEVIASGQVPNGLFSVMKDLSDRSQYFNLYPILHNLEAMSLMKQLIEKTYNQTITLLKMCFTFQSTRLKKPSTKPCALNCRQTSKNQKTKGNLSEKRKKRGYFYAMKVAIIAY